jgi:hypothetical protein
VKNVAKGKVLIHDDNYHNYDFVDEFHEESIQSSIIYETEEDVKYEI